MDISKIFPFLFINECVICGKEDEGAICRDCRKNLFVRGRAKTLIGNNLYFLTTYGVRAEKLINELKKGRVSPISYLISESLELIKHEKIDIITAVPSLKFLFSFIPEHLSLFSKGIAKANNSRYIPVIEKTKRIKSQTLIPFSERLINPKGAFRLKMVVEKVIKDRRILVVDDVYTSGATMRECEKEIMNLGGYPVSLVISKSTL